MKYIEFTRQIKGIESGKLYEIIEEFINGNGIFYYFLDEEYCRSCVHADDEVEHSYFKIVEVD